jgi:5-methylcytosine-specific restriction endonuclease McrA
MNTNTPQYSFNYRKIAFKYAHECLFCKARTNLEVDHIDENRNNNHPSNLRILCHHCHSIRHGFNIKKRKKPSGKYAKGTRFNRRKG